MKKWLNQIGAFFTGKKTEKIPDLHSPFPQKKKKERIILFRKVSVPEKV